MTSVVLDASVVIKWFKSEPDGESARALLEAYRSGRLLVFAPRLLFLEILNVAARSWKWAAGPLADLASQLRQLGFERVEPDLSDVARWAALGLTAYDACYVAVAEASRAVLVTQDELVLRVAGTCARSLQEATADFGAWQ